MVLMPDPSNLAWIVDEACFNSRPSPVEVHFDGWVIRAAGGPVRRTNSTWSTSRRADDHNAIITVAERLYSSLERPSIFRVTSIGGAIDRTLIDHGYAPHAETRVLLCRPQPRLSIAPDIEVEIGSASDAWVAAWGVTEGPSCETTVAAFRQSIDSIALPKAFACRRIDGEPVSLAYGVVHRNLLVIEAVATAARHRRRGHAFHVISSLLRWARTQNADQACLAVLADNTPALALYRSLGFERELYRYHYRRKEFET